MKTEAWELKGTIAQTLYSPRGGIEGFLLDVGRVTVQFVCNEHDLAAQALHEGQDIVAIGTVRLPSIKVNAEHEVFDLVGLPGATVSADLIRGKIVRFNYAKHGERNGVILDSGDFIHTRPDGLKRLGWRIGQTVKVTAHSVRPLWDRRGYVIDVAG